MTKKIYRIYEEIYITKILCETSMRAKIIYKDCNILQHAMEVCKYFFEENMKRILFDFLKYVILPI